MRCGSGAVVVDVCVSLTTDAAVCGSIAVGFLVAGRVGRNYRNSPRVEITF